MGDVTGLAPESLRERELAALLCSTALLGANSSPVRDQSGCHAKCMRTAVRTKKDEGENGKGQLRQMRTRAQWSCVFKCSIALCDFFFSVHDVKIKLKIYKRK